MPVNYHRLGNLCRSICGGFMPRRPGSRSPLKGRRLFYQIVDLLEPRVMLSTVVWVGGTGSWETPSNWVDQSNGQAHVPTSSDDVIISGTAATLTVTITGNESIRSITAGQAVIISSGGLTLATTSEFNATLAIGGGALAAGSNLTLKGVTTWSGNSLLGTVTNLGTLTLTGTGNKALDNATLNNAGVINDVDTGDLTFYNTARLNNQAAGTFNFQADGNIRFSNGSITNAGVFEKTGGTGSSALDVPLNNAATGTLSVSTGTMVLHSDGNSSGGNFTVATGAVLDVTGGATNHFSGTYTGSGGGEVLMSAGTLVTNATFNFPTGMFVWTGGTMGFGTLNNIGVITLNGVNNKALDSVNFYNDGSVVDINSGDFTFYNAAVFDNRADGTFDFQANGSIRNSNGLIINEGRFGKSAGGGNSAIEVPLNNAATGTLSVSTGTMVLHATGNSSGGNFTVATGAVLDVTGGATNHFSGTYTGSGGGEVLMSAGTLVTNATFNFPTGMFVWTGGTMGFGTLNNIGVITLNGVNNKALDSVNFYNDGSVVDINSGDFTFYNAAVFDNRADGTFDFQANGSIRNSNGLITNEGRFGKSAGGGSSAIEVPLNNAATGTLSVSTGTMVLHANGNSSGGNFTVATGAVLDVTGGATNHFSGTYTGSGGGEVLMAGGTLVTNATFNFPTGMFVWTGGAMGFGTLDNVGAMTLDGLNNKQLDSVAFNNDGAVVDVNTGDFTFYNTAVLDNRADGTFDFQANGNIRNSNGLITNEGVFGKSGGTASSIDVPLNNASTGTLTVSSGTMYLHAPGNSSGGNFIVTSNAVLDLTNGVTNNLGGFYRGSGGGTVQMAGGTLNVNATFNFPAGMFVWSGGDIHSGTLNNIGAMTLTGGGNKALDAVTFLNDGTIADIGTGDYTFYNGALMDNRADGTFDFQADGNIRISNGLITNEGTFGKSIGTGNSVIDVPLDNRNGVLSVSSGQVTLHARGTSSGGTFVLGLEGVLDLTGGATNDFTGNFTGVGQGQVVLAGGILFAEGAGATFDMPQSMFQWSGGNIAGATFTNAGFMTLGGNGNKALDGATFDNVGSVRDVGAGDFTFYNRAQFLNEATGVFDFQANGNIRNSNGSISNLGTFSKSGGTGQSTIDVPLANASAGILSVTSGTMALHANGSNQGGIFQVTAGAALDLTLGADNTFAGTYTGSGGGAIELNGGNMDLGAGGATFNFPAGMFQWSGGTIQGGTLTNIGFMQLAGNGNKALSAATLINRGTIADGGSGDFTFYNGALLTNSSSGILDMTGDGDVRQSNGSMTNAGIVEKTGGTGLSYFDVPVNNAAKGTITAGSGSLVLAGSATDAGGIFNAGPGGVLDINGGANASFTGVYTGTGGGVVQLSGGTLHVNGTGATFNFPAGMFVWSGGQITGQPLTNAGYITLAGTGEKTLTSATLNNAGTITDIDSGNFSLNNGARLNNTGVLDIQNDGSIRNSNGVITNMGLVKKSGGTASTIESKFNNLGTLETDAGTLTANGVITQYTSGTLTGGAWIAAGTGLLNLSGAGQIKVNKGIIVLNGAHAGLPQLTTLGSNAGVLSLLNGSTFTTAGSMQNAGTITLGSAAALSVTGAFAQAATGALSLQLGSAPASGQTGSLNVSGAATLAGALNVTLAGGFGPTQGQQYAVMTYGSHKGNFSKTTGLSIGGVKYYTAAANATSVTLTALVSAADLLPGSISAPAAATVNDNITVNYSVSNLQKAVTLGSSWVDSVYLSESGQLDSNPVLLGTVQHTGALNGSASYSATLTAAVPGVLPGNYSVIVVADSGLAVPDSNRANNAGVSAGTVAISMHELAAGTPTAGAVAAGQAQYYEMDLPAGQDFMLTGNFGAASAGTLYVRAGALPDPAHYDFATSDPTALQQNVPLLQSAGSTYYILVESGTGAAGSPDFTLSLRKLGFEIISVAPTHAVDTTESQLVITGSHFSPTTQVQLISASATLAPISLQVNNSNAMTATFDFTGVPPQIFDVQITDNGQTFTLPGSFTVTHAEEDHAGLISTSQEWAGGTVHYVTGNIEVASGATLTIDPGAVVKFGPLVGMTIDAGGSLNAQGTLEQPVVFTSIRDDAAGGDTNSDGNLTAPAAGDWAGVTVVGNATFNYAHLSYGGGSADGSWHSTATIRDLGGNVTFSNSSLIESFFDGILDDGGPVSVSNSLFTGDDRAISGHPGGTATVVNSTFDDNRVGLLAHGETLTVLNSIVTNSTAIGIGYDYGAFAPVVKYTDIYSTHAGSVNIYGFADPIGANGNISADPLYKDLGRGNYQLGFGSPAIDAADGSIAPTTDALGNTRYDDPRTANTGVITASSAYADMGTFEFVESAASTIDLTATQVSGPSAVIAGGKATVTWTDANLGSTAAVGPWHDTINLVLNPGPNQTVIHVADVLVGSGISLGANQTSAFSSKVAIPAGVPGNYYWQVVANSLGDVFEGQNRDNNGGLSATPVTMDLTALSANGTPQSDLLSSAGQTFWYKVTATTNQSLLLSLGDSSAASNIELYAGTDAIPTTTSFLFKSQQFNSPKPTLLIPSPVPGTTYYIAVYARTLDSDSVPFTLTTSTPQFSVTGASPGAIGNSGPVTVEITGGKLLAGDTYQLVLGKNTFTASAVTAQDASTVFATFNLNGAATGTYTLVVTPAGGAPVTLKNAVQVQTAQPGQLSLQLLTPSVYRPNRVFNGEVVYTNTGNVDLPAPILILSANGEAGLRLGTNGTFSSSDITFIGAALDGPAGVLRPGQTYTVPISVLSTSFSSLPLHLSYKGATDTDAVNYSTLSTQWHPVGFPDNQWNPIMAQIQAQGGTTWGSLITCMDRYVTQLAAEGGNSQSFQDVLNEMINQVNFQVIGGMSGHLYVNDTNTPLAGGLVEFTAVGDTSSIYSAVSLADGSFRVFAIPAGTYDVSLPSYTLNSPLQVTVPAGGSLSGVNVLAQTLGGISGTVVSKADNTPLSGATVTARDIPDGVVVSTTTDGSGHYVLLGLPTGTYEIVAGGGTLETLYVPGVAVTTGQNTTGENFQLAGAATLSGTILANGTAAGGVSVTLADAAGNIVTTTTGTDGSYTLTGLSAGTYSLDANGAGFAETITSVTVAANAVTNEPPISLTGGATLTIHLSDSGSNPISGASATLLQNGHYVIAELTDSGGTVALPDLGPGSYTLTLIGGNYQPFSETVTITGGVSQTLNIQLAAGAEIKGTVVDGLGHPVSGIAVNVAGTDSSGNSFTDVISTGTDGSYDMDTIPFGSYVVSVGNNGGIGAVTATLSQAASLQTINFAVPGATLSGIVLAANGTTPVANADVDLLQNGDVLATATTDANGHYLFRALPAGSYTVEAAVLTSFTPAATVTVPTNGSASANLTLGGLFFSGVVKDSLGNPVSGATVTIEDSLDQVLEAIAAADGSFVINGVPAGTFTVVVRGPNAAPLTQSIAIPASGRQTFTLTPGVTVTGQITSNNAPVPGAEISFIDVTTKQIILFEGVDASGNYVANLPAGTYDIVVSASGYQNTTLSSVAVSGASLTENAALSAPSTQLQGAVTTAAGIPLANAVVKIYNAAGEPIAILLSGTDGSWSTNQLAPGIYTVKASGVGYFTQTSDTVTLQVATPATVNLALTDAATDDEGFLSFLEQHLGSFITNSSFLAYYDPKAERLAPDHLTVPAPLCDKLYGMYVDVLDAEEAKDNAFHKWEEANKEFETGVGEHAADLAYEMGSLALSTTELLEGEEVNAALDVFKEGKEFTQPGKWGALLTKGSQAQAAFDSAYAIGKQALFAFADTKNIFLGALSDIQNGADAVSVLEGLGGNISGSIARLAGLNDLIQQLGQSDELPSTIKAPLAVLSSVLSVIKSFSDTYKFFEDAKNSVIAAENVYNRAFLNFYRAYSAYVAANKACPPMPPPPPPPPNPNPVPQPPIPPGQSVDPNDKTSTGFGSGGYILPGTPIVYTVDFENEATASLPAQEVTVDDTLSSNLDWSTFQLGSIGFNNVTITVPSGLQNYDTMVYVGTDLNPVHVQVTFNPSTGAIHWDMQSVDASTGQPVEDPTAGFLPPNNDDHDGEGFVTYSVKPRASLTNGAVIHNQANIVFDINAPILTPITTNTIDTIAPASTILALPATSPGSFTVAWSGTDNAGGSGPAQYDIYVSDNGAAFTPFLLGTSATSATFTGLANHTYSFYSVAHDGAGNVQPTPRAAEAHTTVQPTLSFTQAPTSSLFTSGGALGTITVDVNDVNGDVLSANASTVTLKIASGPAGARLGGTVSVAAVNGVATFTGLTVSKPGAYTLVASDPSFGPATVSFTLSGAADHLVFSTLPNSASAGQAIPDFTVTVVDAAGIPVGFDNSTVTLSLAPGSAAGTVSGTMTAQVIDGHATFTGISLAQLGTYTFSATDGSLTAARSNPFTVIPDASTAHLVITQSPAATLAGKTLAPSLTVAVRDQFGNLVTTGKSKVTLSVLSGPGTFTGTTTVTISKGIATFSKAALTAAGDYTLALSDATLDSTVQFSQTITQGTTTIAAPHVAATYKSGKPIVLSTTLKSNSPAHFTGQVTVVDSDNNVLGTATVSSTGKVTISLTGVAAGTYTVTIQYAGDDNHLAGESTAFVLHVAI